jgi:hypothetical protein
MMWWRLLYWGEMGVEWDYLSRVTVPKRKQEKAEHGLHQPVLILEEG